MSNTPDPSVEAGVDKDNVETSNHAFDQSAPIAPGMMIGGRYRIVSVIGFGGMGTVYRVQQIFLEKNFALKVLSRRTLNSSLSRRFQNEAKAASLLDHSNLVQITDFGLLEDDRPFFVMELVEGVPLSHYLREKGQLTIDRAVSMFIQIGFGLAHAHEKGVVHRDIKPSNIILTGDGGETGEGSVRIVDFGIAKIVQQDEGEIQSLTRTGEIFGSPLYMSPEQCAGASVDHRCDLYSLGCVMYEALTGAPPFVSESAMSTMLKHQKEIPASLSVASLGREFPPLLEEIVAKLLAKSPDDRYQSANEMIRDLISLRLGDASVNESIKRYTRRKEQVESSSLIHLSTVLVLSLLLLTAGLYGGYLYGLKSASREAAPLAKDLPMSTSISDRPFSFVYKNADGKLIRRFHIPKSLDEFAVLVKESASFDTLDFEARAMKTRADYKHDWHDFEIPADQKLCIWLPGSFPSDCFAGLDEDAVAAVSFRENSKVNDDSLSQVGHLRSVEMVSLAETSTSVTDGAIRHLNELPNLKALYLGCSHITAQGLHGLKRSLELSDMGIAANREARKMIAHIQSSRVLSRLIASACFLTDQDLATLSRISSLRDLDLAANPGITDEGMKHLTRLTHLSKLSINHCGTTPKCLEVLEKLPELRVLQVGGAAWTADAIASAKRRLPHCKVVDLDFKLGLPAG